MGLFDNLKKPYPQRWADQALDYKLFFIWEASLMAAMVVGDTGVLNGIDERLLGGALGLWALGLLAVSRANRQRRGWHWGGWDSINTPRALLTTAVAGISLFVFAQGLFPLTVHTTPKFLFAASICVFGILYALDLVQNAEEDFEDHCGERPAVPVAANDDDKGADDDEPDWKRRARNLYEMVGLVGFVAVMAFFYFDQRLTSTGAHTAAPGHTQAIADHGTRVFLSLDQYRLETILQTIVTFGIPGYMAAGLLLHFVAGVPIFSNLRTFRGIFTRRDDP